MAVVAFIKNRGKKMKRGLKALALLLSVAIFLNLSAPLASAHSGSASNCAWLETEKEAFKGKDAVWCLFPPVGLFAGLLFIVDSIGCANEKLYHPEESSSTERSPDEHGSYIRSGPTPPGADGS